MGSRSKRAVALNALRKIRQLKVKQWYRPGHGRMATYVRKGPTYAVTGSRKSQYVERRLRRPVMVSMGTQHDPAIGVIDVVMEPGPSTPVGKRRGSDSYHTPYSSKKRVVYQGPQSKNVINRRGH